VNDVLSQEFLAKQNQAVLSIPERGNLSAVKVSHEMLIVITAIECPPRIKVNLGKRDRETLDAKSKSTTSSPHLRGGLYVFHYQFHGRQHHKHESAKMVYLDTMEEWQRQAKLLFDARPATVRKSATHRLLPGQGANERFSQYRLASLPNTTFRTLTQKNTQTRRGSAHQRMKTRRPMQMHPESQELRWK
jgi:hypothetical protein